MNVAPRVCESAHPLTAPRSGNDFTSSDDLGGCLQAFIFGAHVWPRGAMPLRQWNQTLDGWMSEPIAVA